MKSIITAAVLFFAFASSAFAHTGYCNKYESCQAKTLEEARKDCAYVVGNVVKVFQQQQDNTVKHVGYVCVMH